MTKKHFNNLVTALLIVAGTVLIGIHFFIVIVGW